MGNNIKKNITLIIAFIGLFLTGCKKEFLDKESTDRPSEEQLFNSLSSLQTTVNGLYSLSNDAYGEGTRGILAPDVMGEDALVVSSGNYGRYVGFYNYNITVTSSWPGNFWRVSYRIISNCNNILANIDAVPVSDADLSRVEDIKGQVYALRAFAYFNLVRWFGETAYTDDPEGRGVPISIQLEADFDSYNLPRASVREVYEQIILDIEKAETLVSQNSYKGYLDIYGVQAIAARVYLTMGDWQKAKENADNVISGGFSLMGESEYLSGFNATNGEAIWEQRFADNATNVFLSIPSFTYTFGNAIVTDGDGNGVIDANDIANGDFSDDPAYPSVFGYNTLRVTKNFINLFSDNDYRKKQFAAYVSETDNSLINTSNGFPYRQQGIGYLTVKYQSASALGTGNPPRIRLSEIYLIKAEAEFELGNNGGAADALFQVQQRNSDIVAASTNSGEALMTEIRDERRRELIFEGHRFFDLKRWDLELSRTSSQEDHWSDFSSLGSGVIDNNTLAKNSESKRFCLPIPQDEINANTALSTADQNTVYR